MIRKAGERGKQNASDRFKSGTIEGWIPRTGPKVGQEIGLEAFRPLLILFVFGQIIKAGQGCDRLWAQARGIDSKSGGTKLRCPKELLEPKSSWASARGESQARES